MTAGEKVPAPPSTPPEFLNLRLLTIVSMIVAGATPVLAYLGNLGFAPLVGLAGAACVPFALKRSPASLGTAVLVLLVGWALVSLAWSPAAPRAFASYKQVEQFTGLKLVLQLLSYGAFVLAARELAPRSARTALMIVGVGMTVVLLLVVAEGVRGEPVYIAIRRLVHKYTRPDLARRDVARATYTAVLLIWPAGLALLERGWGVVLLALAASTVGACMILSVDAPFVALIVGGACFLAVSVGGRIGAWLLAAASMVYFGMAPMLFLLAQRFLPVHAAAAAGKLSWSARLDIWRFAVARIGEHPLRGWGLDASRVFTHDISLHPHDAALQIWLELGAPGAILAATFWGWLATRIAALHARDSAAASCAAGSFGAYLTIGALSFGVWQEWWLGLGAIALALVAWSVTMRADRDASDHGPGLRPLTSTEASRLDGLRV